MPLDRIVVVKRETRLEELLQRHGTASQARFYLESRGESYSSYQDEHNDYVKGLGQVLHQIPSKIRSQSIEKSLLATYQFGNDLIIVVGDPGLFVNAAKYANGQPIIAVNPDPGRMDDTFTTCAPKQTALCIADVIEGKSGVEEITMAEARMEDGMTLLAVNDFYIGRRTHVSSRYSIKYGGKSEMQSSDGILVSTGAGSTGWLTSIMTGAYMVTKGEPCPPEEIAFPRNSDYLMFTSMNPFPSKITGASLVRGRITEYSPLAVVSQMPEEGVIFSDGIESDYLEFTAGKTVKIMPAKQKARLVRQGIYNASPAPNGKYESIASSLRKISMKALRQKERTPRIRAGIQARHTQANEMRLGKEFDDEKELEDEEEYEDEEEREEGEGHSNTFKY